MRGKITALLAIAALGVGVSLFVAPSTSHAVTIDTIIVTVGGVSWCDTTSVCDNPIWNLGGGVTLDPSETLVLTQTGGSLGFNFDTSEPGGIACDGTPTCTTTLTINGSLVALSGPNADALAAFNTDPLTNEFNEATDWGGTPVGGVADSFEVFFAYADNLHLDACGDADGNCLPESPWTDATVFIGGGTNLVPLGFPEPTAANHCTFAAANCFDAGAIQIHGLETPTVPQPSTLLLLGTGLVALTAYGRRCLKKTA